MKRHNTNFQKQGMLASRHTLVKLPNIEDKEKNLKSNREHTYPHIHTLYIVLYNTAFITYILYIYLHMYVGIYMSMFCNNH